MEDLGFHLVAGEHFGHGFQLGLGLFGVVLDFVHGVNIQLGADHLDDGDITVGRGADLLYLSTVADAAAAASTGKRIFFIVRPPWSWVPFVT